MRKVEIGYMYGVIEDHEWPDHMFYVKADSSGFVASDHYNHPHRIVVRTATADWEYSGAYRPHLDILGGNDPVRPSPREYWDRTIPGPCFGAHPRMVPWSKRTVPDKKKDIDLFYAGSTKPYDTGISRQRVQALRYAGKNGYDGRPLRSRDYMDKMMRTKVALCPWGNGELCYRMYEAWFCGAIPVMPHTWWVNTWFGKLRAGVHYIPYKPDSSDLAEVSQGVLDEWDSYQNMRENNHKLAHKLIGKEFLDEWKAKVFV